MGENLYLKYVHLHMYVYVHAHMQVYTLTNLYLISLVENTAEHVTSLSLV